MNEQILTQDEQATLALRELYRRYGYMPYKMSRFEEYDLYVRNKDFLPSQEIITFADRNGRLLALKPDVTLSIMKNTAGKRDRVQKLYYNENVYRADKDAHAYREILQAGLECVGDLGSYEIAEVVLLAVKSLELLGDRFVLDISHMGLVSAILEESGLSTAGREEALQCLRQKNSHELAALCAREEIGSAEREKLRCLASAVSDPERLERLLTSDKEKLAMAELKSLMGSLSGYADAVRMNFSVGNDMKYYSGVVFRGYLEGVPVSVLSGGQYDKLLEAMGQEGQAIGFAIRVDLLKKREAGTSVDTVILHDGSADPAALLAAAEEASKAGSVLVTTQLPQDREYHNVIRLV